ncbi:efflux RND transporter periplasmic adaptor subunit [Phaeobacter sp.]|uniref:efflux RND transporter periplasmic adaptor subunit n=1 Tax=Phaeobacter sp. TaxID=1902409 RepID=UPI0025FFBFC1|nr:efflux RND transporter periplasmic adaptor subunit [Phaeobacter sp.]
MLKNLLGATVLAAAVVFVAYPTETPPEPAQAEDRALLQADVHVLKPGPQTDIITAYGQVQPRWQSRLAAGVGGRVVMVSDKLLTGAHFQRGDLLAQIEDISYRSALAAARSTLAEAERALLEEEQRSTLAADDWAASGLAGEASALTLREPHLIAAKSAVVAAQAAVAQAEHDLQQTRITAPFDGVVASRTLNPGEMVQAGAQIAEVFDRRVLEVAIALSARQFARLGTPIGAAVDLTASQGDVVQGNEVQGRVVQGRVVRVDPTVDADNRWITVVVELAPGADVMPGTFLTARIEGRSHAALYAIPQALLTTRGEIWALDEGNRLRSHAVVPVFVTEDTVFVAPPVGSEQSLRLAVPRSGYLNGAVVAPRILAEPRPDPALRAANALQEDVQ